MTVFFKVTVIVAGLILFLPVFSPTAEDQKFLQGSWQAESVKTGGKDVSPENARFMKFIFEKDKLIVKGNFGQDSTEECAYKIDATKLPKHLDIYPPSQAEPVLAIYELNNDKLKVCVKRSPKGERPQTFETESDENLTSIVFKKTRTTKDASHNSMSAKAKRLLSDTQLLFLQLADNDFARAISDRSRLP